MFVLLSDSEISYAESQTIKGQRGVSGGECKRAVPVVLANRAAVLTKTFCGSGEKCKTDYYKINTNLKTQILKKTII